ncbi:hypothetical protein ABIC76_003928 [Ralstonia sp. 1138]
MKKADPRVGFLSREKRDYCLAAGAEASAAGAEAAGAEAAASEAAGAAGAAAASEAAGAGAAAAGAEASGAAAGAAASSFLPQAARATAAISEAIRRDFFIFSILKLNMESEQQKGR